MREFERMRESEGVRKKKEGKEVFVERRETNCEECEEVREMKRMKKKKRRRRRKETVGNSLRK